MNKIAPFIPLPWVTPVGMQGGGYIFSKLSWEAYVRSIEVKTWVHYFPNQYNPVPVAQVHQSHTDAEYIVQACNAYPGLLDKIDQLKAYILRNCDPMDMKPEDAKLYHEIKGE